MLPGVLHEATGRGRRLLRGVPVLPLRRAVRDLRNDYPECHGPVCQLREELRVDESTARRVAGLKFRHDHAVRSADDERDRLTEAEEELSVWKECQELLQGVAQAVQTKAHQRIASLVTRCLQSVYGPRYSFRVEFERKRGKTEARMVLEEDGHEMSPRLGSAGGHVDVAAFALRLAYVMLSNPPPRRLLVMDEPFKFVNGEVYQERVAALLETLAEEMGVQIIMAADDDWLKIGNVIALEET